MGDDDRDTLPCASPEPLDHDDFAGADAAGELFEHDEHTAGRQRQVAEEPAGQCGNLPY